MHIRSLIRDRRGASILEFALIAPIFFLLIMGILEFGLFMFHKVVIESITMQVGREASLNTSAGTTCAGGNDRLTYIRCYVREKSAFLINGEQTQVTINTVAQGGTRVSDICLDVDPPRSTPTCSGSYEDVNGNNVYDPPAVNNSVGAPGDLIEVRVSYPWQVLVPFMKYFIGSSQATAEGEAPKRTGVVMITSSTVFRNEPAAQ